MSIAALPSVASLAPADLLAGYDAHVDGLPVAAGVRFERRRAARQFLRDHPDLSTGCAGQPGRG